MPECRVGLRRSAPTSGKQLRIRGASRRCAIQIHVLYFFYIKRSRMQDSHTKANSDSPELLKTSDRLLNEVCEWWTKTAALFWNFVVFAYSHSLPFPCNNSYSRSQNTPRLSPFPLNFRGRMGRQQNIIYWWIWSRSN